MTKTIKHRLDEACWKRGLSWRGRPDQPLYGPRPYSEYWACAYDPDSGHVAAFVTGLPGWRSAKLSLLRAIEHRTPPPAVKAERKGTVLEREGRDWLLVRFADGTTSSVQRPWLNLGWQPGNELTIVHLMDHQDPILLWGSAHMPFRRCTSERRRPASAATRCPYRRGAEARFARRDYTRPSP